MPLSMHGLHDVESPQLDKKLARHPKYVSRLDSIFLDARHCGT
jgi:hypothetical protein